MKIRALLLLLPFLLPSLSALAQGDGATTYYFGLLRRGPQWSPQQTPEVKSIVQSHLAYADSIGAAGKLVAAGPFGSSGELRGIFLFQVGSLDEARALAEADPLVKSGRMALEVREWWATPGFGVRYDAALKADPKLEPQMITCQIAFMSGNISVGRTAEHEAYLAELKRSGKLAASGIFVDGGTVSEVLILRVESADEAKALTSADPAVKAGELTPDLHTWMVAELCLPQSVQE